MAASTVDPGTLRWRPARTFARRASGTTGLGIQPLWLLIAPVVLVVVGLLVVVLWLSFLEGVPGTSTAHATLQNYALLYTDPSVIGVLLNTLGFALTATAVGLLFGTALAWLAERTDLHGATLLFNVMSIGVLLPGFLVGMGWLFFLHPRIGILNQWFMHATGSSGPLVSVTNVPGMGFVEGLGLAPLVFALTSTSFRTMDPSLEEAAAVHGAPFAATLRRVFLPLVYPGIASSAIYVFAISLASFDVPAIIGLSNRVFTFSTFVLLKSAGENGLPDYGATATMSILMIALALLSSYWYGTIIRKANRYQIVTGKAYRPRKIVLRRWQVPAIALVALYFLASMVIPFLTLVWSAGQQFLQPPSLEALGGLSLKNFQQIPPDLVIHGLTNTLILMVAVPTISLVVGFAFSWMVVRSRSRFRGILDVFAFLPHAVPSIIFAVGAVFAALFIFKPIPLYGSLVLIAIVYIVVRLSFATRLLNSALIQIHHELEEAAAVSGATGLQTARRVLTPLILPALVNGWIWMALLTYRELTVATVLYSPANMTLPVLVWNYWQNGDTGVASAISLVILIGLTPLVVLYWTLGRRHGVGVREAAR